MFSLVSWNVNGIRARLPRLLDWLDACQPSVLCLQETKIDDAGFATKAEKQIQELGYEIAHFGENITNKGRNGVAILSKVGIKDVERGFSKGISKDGDPEARMIWATCGGIRVGCAYTPNGKEIGHDYYYYKLDWLDWLAKQVAAEIKSGTKKLAVVGDFNVAPADIDVWDKKAYEGSIHVSPDERKVLEGVLKAGLTDSLRHKYPDAKNIFSFWDYTYLKFPKNQGMRIDHILVSEALLAEVLSVIVDRNARKIKKGEEEMKPSDHAPVIATFKE